MARTPTDPTKAQVWITKGLDDLDFEFYFPQGPKGDPGGFVAATSIGATSLDDIKTPGHYRQDNGNNATLLASYPVAAAAGFLEVLQAVTPGDLIQRYTPVAGAGTGSGRAMYIRRYFNSAWGAWYGHTSSRTDQTAGRAIYQWDDLNSRDQMIYGDTGRRNLSPNIPTASAGSVLLSRNGNIVNLIFADFLDTSPGSSVSWTNLIPSGFRPANWLYVPLVSTRTCTIQNGGTVAIQSPGNVTPMTTVIQGSITWRTDESWPTSLPGVAVGSIPNL
jgi:hypothetical protein